MDKTFALQFAEEWVNAWNSREIDIILSHYTEDFEIESPYALERFPLSRGLISGKSAVREYWTLGLKLNPNLEFEIRDVLCGVNSISIYYFSKSANKSVIEMMVFDENHKVRSAKVSYA